MGRTIYFQVLQLNTPKTHSAEWFCLFQTFYDNLHKVKQETGWISLEEEVVATYANLWINSIIRYYQLLKS